MTKTMTKKKTKCLKDPSYAIYVQKSREFKDIRYDKDKNQDKGKDKDKDNNKDNDQNAEKTQHILIFEKLWAQGCQI